MQEVSYEFDLMVNHPEDEVGKVAGGGRQRHSNPYGNPRAVLTRRWKF